ncbi:MAG: MBL fold metallo-hydrolase [Hyphomicrobium sp.]
MDFPVSSYVRGPHAMVVKGARWQMLDFPVRYCVFEHPREGLVLIDTGYTQALYQSDDRVLKLYRKLLAPKLVRERDPLTVIAARGAKASDVRHIVVTHWHADHICGLEGFPSALLHTSRAARASLEVHSSWRAAQHGLIPALLPAGVHQRVRILDDAPMRALPLGLGQGFDLFGDDSCLAVALPGHMAGHMGLCFPNRERPLLYAADVTWTKAQYRSEPIPPFPLRMILDSSDEARISALKVCAFERAGGDVVLCHDPVADGTP